MTEYHITTLSGSGHLKMAQISKNIIPIWETFAFGPIKDIENSIGKRTRQSFWKKVIKESDMDVYPSITPQLKQMKKLLQENNTITIWQGPNAQEELTMMFLVSYFKTYHKQMHLIQFPKQKISKTEYAYSLGSIGSDYAKQLQAYKKALTKKEVTQIKKAWKKLQTKNAIIRIRKSKLTYENKNEDYLDKEILKHCRKGLLPSARIVGQVIANKKQSMPDIEFIVYRIRELIKQNKLAYTGKTSSMRYFKIKLK